MFDMLNTSQKLVSLLFVDSYLNGPGLTTSIHLTQRWQVWAKNEKKYP